MFKSIVSKDFAGKTILIILLCVIIFHLLVLTGTVPYTIVWGGRVNSREEMVVFEIVSLTINILMIIVVLSYTGYLRLNVNTKILCFMLYAMTAFFLLNTVGNIFSNNRLEAIIFTPLTLLLAILCLRLALD